MIPILKYFSFGIFMVLLSAGPLVATACEHCNCNRESIEWMALPSAAELEKIKIFWFQNSNLPASFKKTMKSRLRLDLVDAPTLAQMNVNSEPWSWYKIANGLFNAECTRLEVGRQLIFTIDRFFPLQKFTGEEVAPLTLEVPLSSRRIMLTIMNASLIHVYRLLRSRPASERPRWIQLLFKNVQLLSPADLQKAGYESKDLRSPYQRMLEDHLGFKKIEDFKSSINYGLEIELSLETP